MSTPTAPQLIASDVGNVGIKYQAPGSEGWKIEPALVRAQASGGYSFGSQGRAPRPIQYKDGPAAISQLAGLLIGDDAARLGATDLAIVGSAEARVTSDAYLLLHLYTIAMSLPLEAKAHAIFYAGGLPANDAQDERVARTLKDRLNGRHRFTLGKRAWDVTIAGCLLVPQPVAALATLLFTPAGAVSSNGDLGRKRFILDIGGGTSDWTGRVGLTLIPGSEGGAPLGIATAAASALRMIQAEHADARHTTAAEVLELIRTGKTDLHIAGAPVDVAEHIKAGIGEACDAILAAALPGVQRELSGAEIAICGGGGSKMFRQLKAKLRGVAPVTLMPNPVIAIAEGLRRMGLWKLRSAS